MQVFSLRFILVSKRIVNWKIKVASALSIKQHFCFPQISQIIIFPFILEHQDAQICGNPKFILSNALATLFLPRRDGRAVECGGLENR
jgi:hypothetical protein